MGLLYYVYLCTADGYASPFPPNPRHVTDHPVVNGWHRRGLGGGMVIPPYISPARWILLPFVKRLLVLLLPPS